MAKAIQFDFEAKVDREIAVDDVRPAIEKGGYVWLDLDGSDVDGARDILRRTISLDEQVLDGCLSLSPDTKYDNRTTCLHLVIVGCHLREGELVHDRVDLIVGERYFLTIHRDPVPFLEQMKARYHDDFVRFAKSPGFLLYEVWDALLESYEDLATRFDDAVETVQARILGELDEDVFNRFSKLGNDLLHFRKVLAPTRNVLDELATRKSRFVSEATQPFLGGMVPKVERILQDVMVNREILSDSVNLYISIVSHRTNRIMNKLTTVSLIFLPLTFLCGVYGMNFEYLPEFKWEYGYHYFWSVALCVVGLVLLLLRRAKLL